MATNDEGPGKGSGKGPAGASEQPGAKKPAAIIDLKATSVGVEDPKKAAAPVAPAGGAAGAAAGGKSAESKTQDAKPADAKSTDVKPAETKPADAKFADVKPTDVNPQVAKPVTTPASAGSSVPPVSAASVPASAKPVTNDPAKDRPGEKPADKPAIKPAVATSGTPNQSSASATGPAAAKPGSPAPSRGGLMSGVSHLAAGLAGGLLVLLGADALSMVGFDPRRGDNSQVRELEARLSLMETSRSPGISPDFAQRLAVAEQRVAAIEQLRQRLGDVDQRQTALAEGTKALEQRLAAGGGAGDNTAARVAKLEDTLATLSRAAGEGQGGRLPQLAAITGRLADLESTLSNQLAQLRKSVMTDVEARMVSANEASEAARSGTQRIDRELAGQKADTSRLGQRIDSFRNQVDRVELQVKTADETSSSLKGAIEQLRNELKGVSRPKDVAAAVEPVTGRMARLEQTLGAVERSEEERRSSVERIVLALELGNLKRAVERGGPFGAELAQVQRIAGNRFDLNSLERYKDQGVPTAAALHREFRDLVHRMLDADRATDGAGIVDRLLAGAKSIVRVRRTDAAADDTSTEATVARMEAALKEGRLADVAQTAGKLSENARKIAAPWLDRVEASAAVERAITGVEGELKSTLGAAAKRG